MFKKRENVADIEEGNLLSPKLPIKPVSIIPVKGIAKFEKKTGMDNKSICFFEILGE